MPGCSVCVPETWKVVGASAVPAPMRGRPVKLGAGSDASGSGACAEPVLGVGETFPWYPVPETEIDPPAEILELPPAETALAQVELTWRPPAKDTEPDP